MPYPQVNRHTPAVSEPLNMQPVWPYISNSQVPIQQQHVITPQMQQQQQIGQPFQLVYPHGSLQVNQHTPVELQHQPLLTHQYNMQSVSPHSHTVYSQVPIQRMGQNTSQMQQPMMWQHQHHLNGHQMQLAHAPRYDEYELPPPKGYAQPKEYAAKGYPQQQVVHEKDHKKKGGLGGVMGRNTGKRAADTEKKEKQLGKTNPQSTSISMLAQATDQDNKRVGNEECSIEDTEKQPFGNTNPQNHSNSMIAAQAMGTPPLQDKHVGNEERIKENVKWNLRKLAFEKLKIELKKGKNKDVSGKQLTIIHPEDIEVDLHLHSKFKSDDEASHKLKITEPFLIEKYSKSVKIYTDASKMRTKGTSFAMVSQDGSILMAQRLEKNVTVYEAEFTAIIYALQYMSETYENIPIAIMSDALWVLKAIESRKKRTCLLKITLNVLEQCCQKKLKVSLVWVPAHVKLKGNDDADKAAKNALLFDNDY